MIFKNVCLKSTKKPIESAQIIDDGEEVVEADRYVSYGYNDDDDERFDYDIYDGDPTEDEEKFIINIYDTIHVYDDGRWDWGWDLAGQGIPDWLENEYLYSENENIVLAQDSQVLELIEKMLTPEIPSAPGIYQVSADFEFVCVVENLGPGFEYTEDTDIYIDEHESKISDVSITKVGDISE